jgi:hypothetical protein
LGRGGARLLGLFSLPCSLNRNHFTLFVALKGRRGCSPGLTIPDGLHPVATFQQGILQGHLGGHQATCHDGSNRDYKHREVAKQLRKLNFDKCTQVATAITTGGDIIAAPIAVGHTPALIDQLVRLGGAGHSRIPDKVRGVARSGWIGIGRVIVNLAQWVKRYRCSLGERQRPHEQ